MAFCESSLRLGVKAQLWRGGNMVSHGRWVGPGCMAWRCCNCSEVSVTIRRKRIVRRRAVLCDAPRRPAQNARLLIYRCRF
jgi:hypothetical protein